MPKIGFLVLSFLFGNAPLLADGPVTFRPGPDGKPVKVEAAGDDAENKKGDKSGSDNGESENDDNGEKKDKDSEKKDPPPPKIIRRGEVVDGTANPDELGARVGDDGKVAFQFRNQSWVELVDWLAEIAGKPLDWLELPGDRVNLASPGRYTVAETLDLFNRHLLARGFTILQLDGGMLVAKTENINPAIVPRVAENRLVVLEPHTFVRTSFDVGWLPAEKLAEELTALISTNGRLTALTTTNRIEAMDAAINLLDVATVLERERSMVSREALAPEFKLRYLPAQEAKLMLENFLGVKKESAGPLTPQQIQMMQQQQRNQGGAPPPAQKKVEISIVANVRQNSIIIRAPLDRVAIATEFLKRVDVPSDTMASLADIQSSMQVFRLASLDPEKLIEIITEMNILEPTTRIRADEDNNALIVSGSAADRFIINSLIERLDGSGREFHVLQLRRLNATEVAESISFLMGQEKKEDDSSSRRSRYYGYYGYGSNEEKKKETDEFRVAANERYRQVLLWANESEMAQVESLLIKLGEIPPPGGSERTLRMVDASATPETYEYLLRLQQQWKATAGNQLQLPDRSEFKDPVKRDVENTEQDDTEAEDSGSDKKKKDGDTTKEDADADASKDDGPAPASKPSDETVRVANPFRGYLVKTMQTVQHSNGDTDSKQDKSEEGTIRSAKDFDRFFGDKPSEPAERNNPDRPKSPIRIELDSQGNLLLLSSDTKALDQLENLMMQVKPPRRPYHVFKIQYASSFWIKWNLEEYFESDEEGDSEADQLYRWWYDIEEDNDDGPAGLGKGNSLRFVEDPDTNTIVVSGATNEQLRTIEELIELWDVEEPVNKRRMRFTRLVSLKYGKAEPIAETVKEAYRDLLSSNDKSFSGRGGGQGGGEKQASDAPRKREGNGSGLMDRENGNEGDGADFSFKGKLSIGIDSVGNTLLVSAEGEGLLDLVTGMIDKLDLAARSAGEVGIFQLSGDVSSQSIERALKAFGATPTQQSMPRRRSADPDGDE